MNRSGFDLNQVTLPARDLGEAIDFYTRFGLRLIVDSPEDQYARFEIPGSDATLSVQVQAEAGRTSAPAVAIYFETSDPEQAVVELAAAGIEPAEPLEAKPWLWREASYLDPSGNRLLVYHAGENRRNPPWRVGG